MLARDLIALHEAPREVPLFSERYPGLTPEAGYDAARALHDHRIASGWRAVGRKIGFTNRSIWSRYGVYEPIWGTVYDRTLIRATDNRGRVRLEGLVNPRIEPEICFGLCATPQPHRVTDAIDWVAHSVEIVQCPHADWKVTLDECQAHNALHARLVVGTALPFDARIAQVEVVLMKNGREVDRGRGTNVLDSPLLALGHLVSMLKEPLKAGEIISTGTLTDAWPIAAGETWSTRFSGLPLTGLEIQFT